MVKIAKGAIYLDTKMNKLSATKNYNLDTIMLKLDVMWTSMNIGLIPYSIAKNLMIKIVIM